MDHADHSKINVLKPFTLVYLWGGVGGIDFWGGGDVVCKIDYLSLLHINFSCGQDIILFLSSEIHFLCIYHASFDIYLKIVHVMLFVECLKSSRE